MSFIKSPQRLNINLQNICLFECKGIWYKYNDITTTSNTVEEIGNFKKILENDEYTKNITGLFYT